ncbi:RING/U-box superfamily protein [Euphorbia peplus]|nr:RING/U-box superfamily protein [Euphorbia peplus]
MEFDLNQEPPDLPHDPMFGLQTLLSELQTAEGRIEGRIRQLEAVISRTRQRQIWRQNQTAPQTVDIPVRTTASEDRRNDALASQGIPVPIQGRMLEARQVAKNNTHLIAKALGRETDAKNKGSFFDCNICVDMARDPVLTSCGHLFCWPCFYSWSYIGHSDVKECPVCLEKVTDKSIIPIYGNENVADTRKLRFEESGLKVPPRPNAHRIEGFRQKLRDRRIASLAVRNTQLPNIIASMEVGSQPQFLSSDAPSTAERTSNSTNVGNPLMNALQTDGVQQLSRLLERSASFASLSTALNSAMSSAERLFQDLEVSINTHHTRRISRQSSNAVDRDWISSLAAIAHQDSQTLNNATADIDSTVAQIESSSRRTELPRTAQVSNSIEVNSTAPNSSSSRRRREVPMNSDVENESLRNPVRRRLM